MSALVPSRRTRSAPDPEQLDLFPAPEPAPSPQPAGAVEAEVVALPPAPRSNPAKVRPNWKKRPRPLTEASGAALDQVRDRALGDIQSLDDVRRRLEAPADPPRKYAEMRSALNAVAKVLGRPLGEIPSKPPLLGKLLANANPAIAGLTRQRWIKVRSLTLAALNEVGVMVMPARDTGGLSPAWRAKFDALSTMRLSNGLSRMLSYFTREGIEPPDVRPEHIENFRLALLNASLDPTPDTTYRSAARLWNEAAQTVEGWPQSAVEGVGDRRRKYPPWDQLPQSYRDDVEAWLHRGANPDLLSDDYYKALRPATVIGRRKMAGQLGGALLMSGARPEDLTGLADLVDETNAKKAFRVLLDANGGVSSPSIAQMGNLLVTIARRWVRASEREVRALSVLAGHLQVKTKGMRPKNRERLRQFNLKENQSALLLLPIRVFDQLERHDTGGKGEAVRAAHALAVEILIMAPLRRKNIIGIEVDRHIRTERRGSARLHHIVIPAGEGKTEAPLTLPLPAGSARLLETYLETYRPRFGPGSPYLFPGRGGKRRADNAFAKDLKKFIFRETGLRMNMHLFRHLAAKLHLEEHPEGIETVRQILGHSGTRTTLKAYAELQGDGAFRKYEAGVERRRLDAQRLSPAPSPSRRKPK